MGTEAAGALSTAEEVAKAQGQYEKEEQQKAKKQNKSFQVVLGRLRTWSNRKRKGDISIPGCMENFKTRMVPLIFRLQDLHVFLMN